MNTQEELDLWPEPAPALVTINQAVRILNLGRSRRFPVRSLTELVARRRAAETAGAE